MATGNEDGRRAAAKWPSAARFVLRSAGSSMEALEKRVLYSGTTFVVSTDSDSVGLPAAGSLRQAILNANAHANDAAGPDTIKFDLSAGAHAITLAGALPVITDPLVIDALSQGGPAYVGSPLIRLDAGVPGTNIVGLSFQNVGNNTIDGLAITGFQIGISIDNSGGGTGNNSIIGNYLGLSTDGKSGIGSLYSGLYLSHSSHNTIVNNLVSANGIATGSAGIFTDGDSGDVFIGNLVGANAGGTVRLGNGGPGIELHNSANSRIGTDGDGIDAAAERYVIIGNGVAGIALDGAGATGNTIFGNSIGADATGTRALGNFGPGVLVRQGASHNQIGASALGLGNLIANNSGIWAQLGGTHFNDAPGVVVSDGGTGNSIRGNSILNNNGVGIDLAPASGYDGVTVNNANNIDSGPNHLQNYPILLTAIAGNLTTVAGSLNSMPGTTFTLDFYANAAPNASLFGDGQRYLGWAAVTTDASGNIQFQTSLAATTAPGEYLSATATDPDGNTSEFAADIKVNSTAVVLNASTWTPLGPAPISPTGGPPTAGRVADIVPDPGNPNVMYLDADGGGIWKTSDWLDAQPMWVPLTDGESTIDMGSGYKTLAIAPGDSQVLYAAPTGPGAGILRSGNGGLTWTLEANGLFDQASFSGIAVDPVDANTLFVGLRSFGGVAVGVYKSTDGGNHWTNTMAALLGNANSSASVSDLVMDPHDGQTLFACVVGDGAQSGLYRSTDGGGTWLTLPTTGGLLSGNAVGASARIAIAPSNSQVIYAAVFDPTLADANSAIGYPRRYVSLNGGSTWTALAGFPATDTGRVDQLALAVDPNNPAIVYANGNHALFRSTNYGLTIAGWTDIDDAAAVNVRFDPSGNLVLAAEGGVYRWAGGATPFVSKQGNLQNLEDFTIALDSTSEKAVYAIAAGQGGILKYLGGNVWNQGLGGSDVGRVLVSPANPSRLYAYTPAGSGGAPATNLVLVSNDGGATWFASDAGLPSAASVYSLNLGSTSQKAFAMDPAHPSRMVVGVRQVYETGDDAASWHSITANSDLSAGRLISSVGIAASNTNTVYAATDDGKFWATANDGATAWQERDANLPMRQDNRVVDFRIDPANALRIFAVTSADRSGAVGGHVWMTINGGVSWTDISGNLNPENWAQSIAVDWRFATPAVYIGTARGVYRSGDLGASWAAFGPGMPHGIVEDLQLLPNSNLLAAGTYGRGVFEIRVGMPDVVAISSGNHAVIERDADPNFADVTTNGTTSQISIAHAATLAFTGGAGNESFTIDFSNGDPLPAGGVSFDGGLGFNTLSIIGTSAADTLTVGPAGITFASGVFGIIPIAAANVQGVQFVGGSGGADALNIIGGAYTVDADTPSGTPNISVTIGSGATVKFASIQRLAALTINASAAVFASAVTPNVNSIRSLSINGNSSLDLNNQSLLLENVATPIASVRDWLSRGYAGGNWNGTSNAGAIISGLAGGSARTLGYASATDSVQAPIAAGKTLIQYTTPGDADLSGVTDFNDFLALQNGYNFAGNWSAGDFDYSGTVDFNDFLVLQNSYNQTAKGAAAAPQAATVAPASAVNVSMTSAPIVPAVPVAQMVHHTRHASHHPPRHPARHASARRGRR